MDQSGLVSALEPSCKKVMSERADPHHRGSKRREVGLPLLGHVVALIKHYPILQERGDGINVTSN